MSERLVDVEEANLYLFNLLFRHQVYLEGVKAGFAGGFKAMIRRLYDEFAKYVGQTRYDSLDAFSRVEINYFVRRFQAGQTNEFNIYTQKLIALLKDFLAADVEVHAAMFAAATDYPGSQHSEDATAALAVPRTEADNAGLWDSIAQAVIPATGLTIQEMLNNFTATSIAKVTNQLMIGWANGESIKDVLAAIAGDQELRYRDGLFNTFNNQNTAIIATILQHVSAQTQAAVAAELYSDEQWVSVLDAVTTEICRSRNGNIYPAGKGPYPPAHFFCRSKRVPYSGGELHNIPATFF